LGKTKNTGHESITSHQTGIGHKTHVRMGWNPFDDGDARQSSDDLVQAIPLFDGDVVSNAANLSLHPGIDDVLHAEVRRSAHDHPWSFAGRHRGSLTFKKSITTLSGSAVSRVES
jgi:hypothetical protein